MWNVISNTTLEIVASGFATQTDAENEAQVWNLSEGYSNEYRVLRAAFEPSWEYGGSVLKLTPGSVPTGAGGNASAFVCCEGVEKHAAGCAADREDVTP
jgi:hypothetical protein